MTDESSPDAISSSVQDAPERPATDRIVDALGVVDHAKRGLVIGVVLAIGVFGFFVVLPAIDPSRPAREESVVLYLALAFVVATSATLLVATALVVRTVAGRVMTYEKWVRRAAAIGAIGGGWWALTGFLAVGVRTGTVPGSVETVVLGTLPVPVLLLAAGTWAAIARSGTQAAGSAVPKTTTEPTSDGTHEVDHVAVRPRLGTLGGIVALVGVATIHAGTFLETAVFFGETAPTAFGPVIVGTATLAVGTAALASVVRTTVERTLLPVVSGALAGISVGFVLGSVVTGIAVLAPIAVSGCLGAAWLGLGIAVATDPGTYPERPL